MRQRMNEWTMTLITAFLFSTGKWMTGECITSACGRRFPNGQLPRLRQRGGLNA